ncbi:hypothetical protein [Nocardia testacea]|uniref:hypothetical protein n=1 Tax=Nocardia testacea TaxID=248551 RepID=UPI0012F6959B|nr:hypothetical protein [Nocardia testacea]
MQRRLWFLFRAARAGPWIGPWVGRTRTIGARLLLLGLRSVALLCAVRVVGGVGLYAVGGMLPRIGGDRVIGRPRRPGGLLRRHSGRVRGVRRRDESGGYRHTQVRACAGVERRIGIPYLRAPGVVRLRVRPGSSTETGAESADAVDQILETRHALLRGGHVAFREGFAGLVGTPGFSLT